MADAQVSGSCGQPCGFKSLRPHQKKESTVKVFSFFVLTEYMKGFEGGENRESDLFVQKCVYHKNERRQTKRLIIVCRGALLKAQIPSSAPAGNYPNLLGQFFFCYIKTVGRCPRFWTSAYCFKKFLIDFVVK